VHGAASLIVPSCATHPNRAHPQRVPAAKFYVMTAKEPSESSPPAYDDEERLADAQPSPEPAAAEAMPLPKMLGIFAVCAAGLVAARGGDLGF